MWNWLFLLSSSHSRHIFTWAVCKCLAKINSRSHQQEGIQIRGGGNEVVLLLLLQSKKYLAYFPDFLGKQSACFLKLVSSSMRNHELRHRETRHYLYIPLASQSRPLPKQAQSCQSRHLLLASVLTWDGSDSSPRLRASSLMAMLQGIPVILSLNGASALHPHSHMTHVHFKHKLHSSILIHSSAPPKQMCHILNTTPKPEHCCFCANPDSKCT